MKNNNNKKLIIYSAVAIVLCFMIGIPVGKFLFDVVNVK